MESLKKIPKPYVIFGGIIGLLVVVIIVLVMSGGKKEVKQAEKPESVLEQPAEVIPTVDSSVEVDITGRTDAVITVSNLPKGTESIEYELSYDTKSGSIEGVFGTIDVKSGGDSVEEKIKFGTCSSGVCRYHEIDGKVKGSFKFNGSYGSRLLEKEFSL